MGENHEGKLKKRFQVSDNRIQPTEARKWRRYAHGDFNNLVNERRPGEWWMDGCGWMWERRKSQRASGGQVDDDKEHVWMWMNGHQECSEEHTKGAWWRVSGETTLPRDNKRNMARMQQVLQTGWQNALRLPFRTAHNCFLTYRHWRPYRHWRHRLSVPPKTVTNLCWKTRRAFPRVQTATKARNCLCVSQIHSKIECVLPRPMLHTSTKFQSGPVVVP